jgi:hypothetical protein
MAVMTSPSGFPAERICSRAAPPSPRLKAAERNTRYDASQPSAARQHLQNQAVLALKIAHKKRIPLPDRTTVNHPNSPAKPPENNRCIAQISGVMLVTSCSEMHG